MKSRRRSFSQEYGYDEVPGPFSLEELPVEARTRIWNRFFVGLEATVSTDMFGERATIGQPWLQLLRDVLAEFDNLPIDELTSQFKPFCAQIRRRIEEQPFNRVFDLIELVVSHPQCPAEFATEMRRVFVDSHLAYTLDLGPPPTIVPAVTPQEGEAIVESLQSIRQAGLDGSATHLRKASAYINEGRWADSVRESIHAVESVARQLDPAAAQTLGPALKSQPLHPALKKGFASLYGYTADEQGVRHALLDQMDAKVGRDEAVFMLGACASFASYLFRKHETGAQS